MNELFYAFNDTSGDHHIVPVSLGILTTTILGKTSKTTITVGAVTYMVDTSAFVNGPMDMAQHDRAVWGNDNGHDTTTGVSYLKK